MRGEGHTVYFKAGIWARLRRLAQAAGVSVSEWIHQQVEHHQGIDYTEKGGKKNGTA